MSVMLRLKRTGRRRRPFYRLEAIHKRNSRGGRSIEVVGLYDPLVADNQKRVKLEVDRIQHWLNVGARPSQTVTSFLRKVDVKYGKKKSTRRSAQRDKKRAAKGK